MVTERTSSRTGKSLLKKSQVPLDEGISSVDSWQSHLFLMMGDLKQAFGRMEGLQASCEKKLDGIDERLGKVEAKLNRWVWTALGIAALIPLLWFLAEHPDLLIRIGVALGGKP
jgi:hypothetical protein